MAPAPVVRILERIARQPTAPMHEHAVLEEATRLARGFGASVRRDPWGNLLLSPPGKRGGPAVWLVAHTDHPGVEITGSGHATVLGGVRASYFRRGLRLRFYHDGEAVPARLARYAAASQRVSLQDGPEARSLRRGDFGVFELEDFRLSRSLVHARQLDDLAGSAVSLAVMERACLSRRLNLHALLTRAEEIGFVGSLGAAADRRIPAAATVVNIEASKAIPGVQPCLDFAHLHARAGDGTMNTYDEWSKALEMYAKILGDESLKRRHIHLSGIEYGPKGEKNPLPLEEADLDLKFIFRALHDLGCSGRILCESPIMEEDALNMKKAWLKESGENE